MIFPFKLTDEQKNFLLKRNIKQGCIYMLPIFGFYVFNSPASLLGEYLPANPWTLPAFKYNVRLIQIDGDFVEIKFVNCPKKILKIPSFWVRRHTIEDRGLLEIAIVAVFCYVPFLLKNLYVKFTEKQNDN